MAVGGGIWGPSSAATPRRRDPCSWRPAIRGRGRNAPAEDETAAIEPAGGGAGGRAGKLVRTGNQRTGRGGHGLIDVLNRRTVRHRRTPHGRAFACAATILRHHESNGRRQGARSPRWPSRRPGDPHDLAGRADHHGDDSTTRRAESEFHPRPTPPHPVRPAKSTGHSGGVGVAVDPATTSIAPPTTPPTEAPRWRIGTPGDTRHSAQPFLRTGVRPPSCRHHAVDRRVRHHRRVARHPPCSERRRPRPRSR